MVFYQQDAELNRLGKSLLDNLWVQYPKLARNQLALTWWVYDPPYMVNTGGALAPADFWNQAVRGFSYRGMERIYPASVVKLFYAVAVQEWLEKGMISPSEEVDRALRDALIESSNDATSYLVDVLAGNTSGPELPTGPFETWQQQRQIVNRYLQSFGWEEFQTINVCQKTWSNGPYGRERAFLGADYSNRNYLTTDAAARLLHAIVGGVAVSSGRSQALMNLLRRSLDPAAIAALDPDTNQVTGFLGEGLPPTAQLWSKAGWMSRVRWDCAYIELTDARPFGVVVAIDSPLGDRDRTILPQIARWTADAVRSLGNP
jgi:beta-lactamase class A